MTFSAQRLAAAVLAAGGFGLVLWGAGGAATAVRARQAFVSSCDRIPPAATNGVWVRLQGCGIIRDQDGFLDDAKGWHLRRVVPVWRISAEATLPPAQIVVAVQFSAAEDQPPLRILSESAPTASDGLARLADTMGVVTGRIGANGYHVSNLTSDSTSIAQGAAIINVVAPPTFKDAGMRALPGLALLAVAWVVFTYQPRSRIIVFASAGMVALLLGVRWYSAPAREATSARGSTPPPAGSTAAAAGATRRLDAASPGLSLSLDQLLARVPRDRRAFEGNLSPDLSEVIDVLAKRANEGPEQIRDALMPAIYSSNFETRRKVLTAFRSMHMQRLPPALVAEASAKGKSQSPFQREAFEAALALGARRLNPELLIAGSRNATTSASVLQELRINTDDASARILARIWVDGADTEFNRLAYTREKSSHDVSAAVLEIVLDDKQPETRRTQAAHLLGTLNEVGALPPLRTFAMTLTPGVLQQSVDNTVDRLDVLRRQGRPPQMRTFETRTN